MATIDIHWTLNEAIKTQQDRINRFRRDPEASQREFNDAMKVMGGLLGQARSLAKDGIRFSKRLTQEERRAVIVEWFESLPPAQQKSLLDELTGKSKMKAVI